MRDFFRLTKFLKAHMGIFSLAVVCMFISALFDGIQIAPAIPMIDNVFTGREITVSRTLPSFLTRFINTINLLPRSTLLQWIVVVTLALFLLKGITLFIRQYLMTNVGQLVLRDIRNALYTKYQHLSLDYYSENKIGALVSRITYDVSVINDSVSQGLTDIFYQGFKVIILFTVAIIINWRLFLISFILFPFISIPVVKIGKALRKISTKVQEKMGEVTSILQEGISGIRIVKTFSMENYEIEKFARANQGFYKFSMKSTKRILSVSPITEFVGTFAAMVVLYVGGMQVIQGTLSFGMFVAFMGAMLQCVQPFKRLSNINAVLQQAAAAATRVFQILDTPADVQDKEGAIDISEIKEAICFENVSFKYRGDKEEVLRDINLEVPVGTTLAIVGPSGVGKSTLVNLVGRFYDVTEGHITIDGRDIRDIGLRSLRGKIGIVTQEMFLFNDTVRANIAYGNIQATSEEIVRAAHAARADEFIQTLPQRYDTVIGDRGFRLSGGEKQRLAIARALLKNPPILILDEATSQLDTESEILVQEAIDRLMKGRTVLIIAHRLSTIRNATKIVVLDKNSITEIGDHQTLMAKGGLYKRLYEMQFHQEK